LTELHRQKNKNLFVTPYIQIIIDYLYKQYRRKIIMMMMPPYVVHLALVYLLIILSERDRSYNWKGSSVTYDEETIKENFKNK
jgi:hypothetical protein